MYIYLDCTTAHIIYCLSILVLMAVHSAPVKGNALNYYMKHAHVRISRNLLLPVYFEIIKSKNKLQQKKEDNFIFFSLSIQWLFSFNFLSGQLR